MRSIANNLGKVVTKSDRFSPIKSNDPFPRWLRKAVWQIKNVLSFGKTYGHQIFKCRGLEWGNPGYQAISLLDYKVTCQMKNSYKYLDFYSTRISDYKTWLGGDMQWNVMQPSYPKYATDI